ncbi:MAG: malectin domain-containing carbohydrate-binding protein [Sedimentisphaerales bacterium]
MNISNFRATIRWCMLILFVDAAVCNNLTAASARDSYYAHKTVLDEYGVISPWNSGQNGPLDMRLRIAVEVLKRYPWVNTDKAVMAAPDFVYNSHWSIKDDGTILVPQTNDWMCGDLSQRAWSIIKGLTAYYAYSSDPIAFVYIPLTADYILDYAQTDKNNAWPMFPIATPTLGKAYGKCDPKGRNQLDLCAIVGTEMLRAYKLTGNKRYFEAAKHWGDVFAEKCNLDPTMPPWNRYTDPSVVGWSDELTGSTTMILDFLDELIRLGYTGKDRAIINARQAGIRYINNELLANWLENDHWGRQYWDWDNPVMCGIVSMISDYIMKNPQDFCNWKTDLRNMLTLIFNRNGADPGSHGNMFSGAWAFPESCTCCGTSLSYNQYTAGPTLIRYGALADDDRISEIGRRMIIMATYDSDENGVVKDGIFGEAVATGEWSNLAHPWPLCQVMEALAWAPEVLGPKRENHIMRSTSVVNSVVYEKNKITYSTFDAPLETANLLRLSFEPTIITADGQKIPKLSKLRQNGWQIKPLPDGDFIVNIRHDGKKNIIVTGETDKQNEIDGEQLQYEGKWQNKDKIHTTADKDAAVVYSFKGNQVRVIGNVAPDGGFADVWLDGQKQLTLIDCWNPAVRQKQLLYYKNGLSNDKHELKIVILGKGNLISKGSKVYIDSIQYSDAEADRDFGQGSGPQQIQRMIFGYPLRQDYIDSKGNAWRPATEWVIRSGYGNDTVQQAWWTKRRSMYIGNTEDPELYRYGAHGKEFWANLTVGPGTYYVRLKFADTPLHPFLERNKEGNKISHTVTVKINDKEVISKMNITQEAGGPFRAVDRLIRDIQPENGSIEVWFIGEDEYGAAVQALEIGLMSELGS